jgi:hypothetical protein
MSQRADRLACIALIAVFFALLLAGCGGGGSSSGGGGNPPPPSGTAAISGVVVDASNTSTPLPSAVIHVSVTGASTTSASDGTFSFTGLPVGSTTLTVDPGPGGNFFSSVITVPLSSARVTSVVVTMIPLGLGVPTRLTVSPDTASTDPGGQQVFSAVIFAGSTQLSISPSWVVQGGIGTINSGGVFTATNQGNGQVIATAGTITGSSNVTVTAPQPPRIWSTFIDPGTLPTSGGSAVMTLHATDGDGIALAQVQIVRPDGTNVVYTMARTAGTTQDGTWVFPDPPTTSSFVFPANSNLPDSTGAQAPMDYDVRFIVTDASAAHNVTTSGFTTVRVAGVEAPPPPP